MSGFFKLVNRVLQRCKRLGLNKRSIQIKYVEHTPQSSSTPQSEGYAKDTQRRKQRHRKSRKSGEVGARPNHTSRPWTIDQFVVPEQAGRVRFHDFNLPDELMRAVQKLNFMYCTPIQAEILGPTLTGRDAVGKAQTGTGKTAAFLIAAIKQLLNVPPPAERYLGEPRAIIVAPTRELAMQIHEDAKALTCFTALKSLLTVGGVDYETQKAVLENNFIDIVVATPGRLLDFLERKNIYLDLVEIVVLDEADRMLDMGFIPQVRKILRRTPRAGDRQTLLFSATFSDDVMHLVDQWTWHPVKVDIDPGSVATKNIDQKVYLVSSEDKYTLLLNFLTRYQFNRVIIFANRRDETRLLSERLQSDGIRCATLSGEVPQKKRVQTLNGFKAGQFSILVATDVAGRGIHVDGISHVINFNLPENADDYVHRIGRAGRAGSKGESISFACEDDSFLIPELENTLSQKLAVSAPPADLL